MAFYKFTADQLFDGYRMHDHDAVLITDEKGAVQEIVTTPDAGDDVQRFAGILSPGFINCHCHLELSHMKGHIPQGTGLTRFVTLVMKDRHLAEELIADAIDTAEEEMFQSGIVAVGDICNNPLTIAQKKQQRLQYHNFIEASGFVPAVAEARFQRAAELLTTYRTALPYFTSSIVPHAPYSVSDALWERIVHFPENRLLTIHNQESAGENEFFLSGNGEFPAFYAHMGMDYSFFKYPRTTSLQDFLPRIPASARLILVHNVHTSAADIDFTKQLEVPELSWCLCPNANRYIGGQLPDVELFIHKNLTLVMGTDSLASNTQLSIAAEMATLIEAFPSLQTERLLQYATINGARALQLDDRLGSFEPGKTPGIVLTDATFSAATRLL